MFPASHRSRASLFWSATRRRPVISGVLYIGLGEVFVENKVLTSNHQGASSETLRPSKANPGRRCAGKEIGAHKAFWRSLDLAGFKVRKSSVSSW